MAEHQSMQCEQCGATLPWPDNKGRVECGFCGAKSMVENHNDSDHFGGFGTIHYDNRYVMGTASWIPSIIEDKRR